MQYYYNKIKCIHKKKGSTLTGLVWDTNMASVVLVWDTRGGRVVTVTPCSFIIG